MIATIQAIRRVRVAACAFLVLGIAACSGHNASQLLDTADGADWPAFGRTYGEQHFSPLTQINRDSIGRLRLAWSYDLPPENSASVPIEVGGVLFTATGHSVIRAFNAATGKLLWQYDPKAAAAAGERLRQGWGSRGIAWWNGMIYTGTQDGRLIALDAKSGSVVWSVQTLMTGDHRFISGPPRVFDGKVIIGHGGGDAGAARGYVTAYDAATGRQMWRFFTVPGDPAAGFENDAMAMAAKTWAGEWWKNGGGGTVWNAMTYDAELDQILIGTGNGYPWNHKVRSAGKGDNLFLSSIIALDAKTGTYKWHYQTNPGESWDYNAAMDMPLATLQIAGEQRKVVMQAPKNGFYYVIDRTNGKLISAEPIVKVTWASRIDTVTGRPVENPAARYPDGTTFRMLPGASGAHSWNPMAYDPRSAIGYIPVLTRFVDYSDKGIDKAGWRSPGHNIADSAVMLKFDNGNTATSALVAWDARTQKQVWRVVTPGPWNGGVMATAGDLVFQGGIDGNLNAYDAKTGARLWRFAAGAGIVAAPISFSVKGRQYVAVISGWGGSAGILGPSAAAFGWDYRTQPRRVLVFALDGKAPPLPVSEPYRAIAFADPDYRPDVGTETAGAIVFGRRCMVCHGGGAVAAGSAPDLRASPLVMDMAALNQIVRQGALAANGMPGYGEMTDEQFASLRQYLRGAAHALRGQNGQTPPKQDPQ